MTERLLPGAGYVQESGTRQALAPLGVVVNETASTGAVTHSTTGALTGQESSVSGTAAHVAKHATSGALSGQGSSVVGAAARFRAHATSGGLTGQGSVISGSAARSAAGIHDTSGVLSGQGSSISGTAARSALHATSGVLEGPGASVVGVAAHKAIHATSGALTGPGAQVVSIAVHSGSGAESGKVGGDDVPLSRKQLKELAKRERKADEARRERWAQAQHDDAALSDEISRLYRKLQGEEDVPAEDIAHEVVEAPQEVIAEAVKELPIRDGDYSQVAASIMQMVAQARAYQEHRARLMEEDELILMMVA